MALGRAPRAADSSPQSTTQHPEQPCSSLQTSQTRSAGVQARTRLGRAQAEPAGRDISPNGPCLCSLPPHALPPDPRSLLPRLPPAALPSPQPPTAGSVPVGAGRSGAEHVSLRRQARREAPARGSRRSRGCGAAGTGRASLLGGRGSGRPLRAPGAGGRGGRGIPAPCPAAGGGARRGRSERREAAAPTLASEPRNQTRGPRVTQQVEDSEATGAAGEGGREREGDRDRSVCPGQFCGQCRRREPRCRRTICAPRSETAASGGPWGGTKQRAKQRIGAGGDSGEVVPKPQRGDLETSEVPRREPLESDEHLSGAFPWQFSSVSWAVQLARRPCWLRNTPAPLVKGRMCSSSSSSVRAAAVAADP
ncbi:uncharacterized protein LOC141937135 [Strix uralensis]|uniref:uncharacterized protein LOC141937135 n=1 Tax=Strix uralensis TaxID=36305 RepID=UPI003DA76B97